MTNAELIRTLELLGAAYDEEGDLRCNRCGLLNECCECTMEDISSTNWERTDQ